MKFARTKNVFTLNNSHWGLFWCFFPLLVPFAHSKHFSSYFREEERKNIFTAYKPEEGVFITSKKGNFRLKLINLVALTLERKACRFKHINNNKSFNEARANFQIGANIKKNKIKTKILFYLTNVISNNELTSYQYRCVSL